MPTKADSPTKTCTTDGCSRPLRAKGMCVTHYNRQSSGRHKTITVACDGCGTLCQKEPARLKRYPAVYCTPKCKTATQHSELWLVREQTKEAIPGFICGVCHDCGTGFVTPWSCQPSPFCSRTCRGRVARRRRRAREYEAPGSYRWVDVIRAWVAGHRQCAYCDMLMPNHPDPDHVIPLSRGGRNDMGNILPCCQLCNSDKCDMTLDEWAQDRARRGLPPVRTVFTCTEPRFRHLTLGTATGKAWRHRTAA